ncbi:hypothetical protein EDB84DRAFT_61837 [Lactarius hengduanensis]|nr:hypothetical protein EDB84DRAFT_61837 [Lactarius hengduanensis]
MHPTIIIRLMFFVSWPRFHGSCAEDIPTLNPEVHQRPSPSQTLRSDRTSPLRLTAWCLRIPLSQCMSNLQVPK